LVKIAGGTPLTRWSTTRQDGCGRIILRNVAGGGLAESTYVFDATTHELLGLNRYSDTSIDSCGRGSIAIGIAPTCREGRVCLTCGGAEDCVDACSVAEREREGGSSWRWQDLSLVACEGLAPAERPRLTTGCGRIVQTRGSSVVVFDEASHQAIAVRNTSAAPTDHCGGAWGEAEAACATETSCSLCDDDPAPCAL
jgi:hypothetical protein